MKKAYLIILTFLSHVAFAQCPDGDVVLNSQNDVNEFVAAYPNCTNISGDLVINSQSAENPIQNLTALSGLQAISGTLRILDLDYFDAELDSLIPGSLQGLEGLTSVNEIWIGQGSDEPSYHIESLEPLNNITGFVERIRFNEVVFYEALPDFVGITFLENFVWNTCTGVSETPEFPNVETIRWISIENDPAALDSLKVIHIPNVESIEGPFGGTGDYGIRITACPNLESIIGGDGLSYIEEIELTALEAVTDLSAFDDVTEIGLEMLFAACDPEAFHSFKNLSSVGEMKIFINHPPFACEMDLGEVQIRFGEDAESFTTDLRAMELRVKDVETVEFTANIEKLTGLVIESRDVGAVLGLDQLDSLVTSQVFAGSLILLQEGTSGLPDLSSLKYVSNSMGIYLTEGASLDNLNGLESLEEVYNEIYVQGDETASLTSLAGLENLKSTQKIYVQGLEDFNDLSAVFNMEYLEGLFLYSLPEFQQIFDFQNPEGFNLLVLSDLPMTDLSQLQNFDSIPRLELLNNDFLETTAGMESIDHMFSLNLIENPVLSTIELPFELGIQRVEWTDNPSLNACPDSPLICDILLNADPDWRVLESNGSGCNDVEEIIAACTLNDDLPVQPYFRIGVGADGELVLFSNLTGEAALRVYDLTGRIVATERFSDMNESQSVFLSGTASGVYVLELQQGTTRLVQKAAFPGR